MARLGLFIGVTAPRTVGGEGMGQHGQARWTWPGATPQPVGGARPMVEVFYSKPLHLYAARSCRLSAGL
jgi:hypothetical protein